MIRASLLAKLLVAFALVILVAVTIIFVVANQTTNTEFHAFMFRGGMTPSSQIARELAAYYSARHSWQGVDAFFERTFDAMPGQMMSGRMPPRGMSGMMNASILLVDANGNVIASRDGSALGQKISSGQLAQGVAVQMDGQTIGTLVFPSPTSGLESLEQEFLQRVNRSIFAAGVVAGVIAFVLGSLLVYHITAPLNALAAASRKIAAGDLTARITQPRADEIGQVGRAFNAMADSLAQSEAARRNMIADIAHELRNPLGVLRGQLEGLIDGVFPATPEQFMSLHEETLLLTRLVEDLHELALADAGQLQINRAPTNLGALIEKTVTAFTSQANDKHIALKSEIANELPRVNIDDQRIEQVLRNLIGNALRHTPEGGLVSLRCSREAFGGSVKVSVGDSGAGIAAEDLPRVFERFYRGDKSRSRGGGGAGLGLAIAKQIVNAHGGVIGVESEPGRGATFWFTVPV